LGNDEVLSVQVFLSSILAARGQDAISGVYSYGGAFFFGGRFDAIVGEV